MKRCRDGSRALRIGMLLAAGVWVLLACNRQGYQSGENPCEGVDCSGYGTCVLVEGGAQCLCVPGYRQEGLDCVEETIDDPCIGVTCSGFGKCAVRDMEAYCVCVPGFHNPEDDQADCEADDVPCEGADGTPCDDDQFCTVDDTCMEGVCVGTEGGCDDGNSCTVDLCNEVDDACTNTVVPDGAACEDGEYCNIGETCTAGECGGGTARACSDGNTCTSDACDENADTCVNTLLANGTGCDDGAYCTVDERCAAGFCMGGVPRDCSDGNECTADVCNDNLDACENAPVADGTGCDDGAYCTVGDACSAGACVGSGARDCSDGNPCTADACDDVDDTCVHSNVTNETVCNDGQFCTLGEVCTGGACGGGTARDCSDGNPCTVDACDDDADTCDHVDETDGTACDDGLECTENTTCDAAGACVGGTPLVCSDGNACTIDSCSEAAGGCIYPVVPDGAACDDGDFCTIGDQCNGGVCGGAPNLCDDGNDCTDDSCSGVACENDPAAHVTDPCDDGLACTENTTCDAAGACVGGTPLACSDGNDCTIDSCSEAVGGCTYPAVPDGSACDDGDFCTVGEMCTAGTCGGGVPNSCNDGNPCTDDSCSGGACVNDPIADGNSCDDGAWCTEGETCTGGLCGGGAGRDCSDGDACTADGCNEVADACMNNPVADGTACDDNDACNVGETCTGGACGGGAPPVCDDGNDCTQDSCSDPIGCVNDPVPMNGLACDDGLYCNENEVCGGGICAGGTAVVCADVNQCTVDSCDEGNDQCDFNTVPMEGLGCDDTLYCTVNDVCTGGVCGGAARVCDDGDDVCTADSCDDVADTCVFTPQNEGAACDDGLYCTNPDQCTGGVCGGPARVCDDGVACTVDFCNEGDGACDSNPAAVGTPCEDGAFCTVGDTCDAAGVCQAGSTRSCDDGNDCTIDNCVGAACDNTTLRPNGWSCEVEPPAGLFCNGGDNCQSGVCQEGSTNPCGAGGNPCAGDCNEDDDICGGNCPAADDTYCMADGIREATCDGVCDYDQIVICDYSCNAVRQECNECDPSTIECKGDIEYLCNAEFVCGGDGLLLSKTCCTTNRCACDGTSCLEDMCAASDDVSGGGIGILTGDTCGPDGLPGGGDDLWDNIPGDCNPGGSACNDAASGGAPEMLFQFTLDDDEWYSEFYSVTLDSYGPVGPPDPLDAQLRVSTICANETSYNPMADVCGSPAGTTTDESCYESAPSNDMVMCGLPEGTYYGAVDSPSGECGAFSMDVTMAQVYTDTEPEAGNISRGGTFTGYTCNNGPDGAPGTDDDMNDDYWFEDIITWGNPSDECDCIKTGGNSDCPDCGVNAATDCTITPQTQHDWCTYHGGGSNDAVFYLALEFQSGVDISTAGSDYDTVLYIKDAAGGTVKCNDDCWANDVDGASHIQTSLPAGLYYVYVDGAAGSPGGSCGTYNLDVIISPAASCGNLICEAPFETCANCPFDCPCPNCGDGVLDSGEGEECDDVPPAEDGDGCSSNCVVEGGYVCDGEPSVCTPGGRSCPGRSIPDPGSMTDVINIPVGWTISDINVEIDISHTWIGDLVVELTSPLGTTVRLHDESGGATVNINTNYDLVTAPDGPGSMADFDGENAAGNWTLFVSDSLAPDPGILNCWTISIITP